MRKPKYSPAPNSKARSSNSASTMTKSNMAIRCTPTSARELIEPDTEYNATPSRVPSHHLREGASSSLSLLPAKLYRKETFKNPWPSFNGKKVANIPALKFLLFDWTAITTPADVEAQIPLRNPQWKGFDDKQAKQLKATWLGHAAFLLELPRVENASRGARVLFDPVFCVYCAPFDTKRTARHTKAPVQVEQLPEVDLVVISHNHYDHMDPTTLKKLWARFRPRFVLPLGNAQDLRDNGIPDSHITSLDWWQHRVVVVEIEVQNTTTTKVATALAVFEITCVPSQHQSNRGPLDRNAGLWSGFTITSLMPYTRKALEASRMPSALSSMESTQFTCYFAGDTGYAYSPDDNVGEERCPAFKEMGARFDGFDLALLPIGAYKPREFTSSVHASPADSVEIYKDVKARKAIGMHWGTWALTNEELLEPRDDLQTAFQKAAEEGVSGSFDVCGLAETVFVDCRGQTPSSS